MTTPNSKTGTVGQHPNRAASVSMDGGLLEGPHLFGRYWKDLSTLSTVTEDRLGTRKPFIHALSTLVHSPNVDNPKPHRERVRIFTRRLVNFGTLPSCLGDGSGKQR